MKYRQAFRVPAKAAKAWNGVDYVIEQATTELTYSAAHDRQAFVIAQKMAARNGWAVSGQPVKLN